MTENNNFTKEEDFLLIKLVRMFGTKKWKNISVYLSKIFPDRPKNQNACKSRWFKNINPKINQKGWSLVEEYVFFESQKILGNKWATISKLLPGRTDNNIKNHFYSTLRKNIRRFLKDKSYFSCLKDKIKTFYTLMYAREKFLELRKFYNFETNTVDLQKSKSDNVNFDDCYVTELICKSKGSIDGINRYITNICLDFLEKDSDDHMNKYVFDNFDINSEKHVGVIFKIISKIIMQNAISSFTKTIPGEKKISINDSRDKKNSSRGSGTINSQGKIKSDSINSFSLSQSSAEENFLDENLKVKINCVPTDSNKSNKYNTSNYPLPGNNHNKAFNNLGKNINCTDNVNNNPCQIVLTNFKTILTEDKINTLINKFTKNFTYETNFFDNIKNPDSLNLPYESSFNNIVLSHLGSDLINQGKGGNSHNNIFEDKNDENNMNSKKEKSFNFDNSIHNSCFINSDVKEKLQSVNNFGIFKSVLEKIIINNIVNMNPKIGNNNNNSIHDQNIMENNPGLDNNPADNQYVLNENDLKQLVGQFENYERNNTQSMFNLLQNKTNRSQNNL